jgi:monovalent cation/proton antiporter, MnhG/PhaG subunit
MALRIVIDVLIVIGAFFALAGTIGVLKMPDTFCRMQASTCIPTLGTICVAIAGILYAALIKGSAGDAIKIGVIALMIVVTNPIGAHTIAKGAYKAGVRPEKELTPDDYGRDFNE